MGRVVFILISYGISLFVGDFKNVNLINSDLHAVTLDSAEIIVRVGNLKKDTASTSEIIANRGLRILLNGYPEGTKFRIISFSLTLLDRYVDTVASRIATDGNLLSFDQIIGIKKLQGRGKLIFHEIRVVGGSGRVRELPPFFLIVQG